jgi:hypothetical protein
METQLNAERIQVLKQRIKYIKEKMPFCTSSKINLLLIAYSRAKEEIELRESNQYKNILN